MFRNINVTAVLAFVFFLGGCAFGTRQPTLIYPPTQVPSEISVAHADVIFPPKSVQIILKPFIDKRSDNVVGTVRNGFGMRTADVIPINNVSDWVTQAVAIELRNNGYTVISGTPDNDSRSLMVVVSGDILNVFCDAYFNYSGQVSLVTRASRGGKGFLYKHYSGEGSAGTNWAASEESYAQSLALALSSALRLFVSDLNKSLTSD